MGSYSKLNYHVVFGTKYRRKTIPDELRNQLYSYTGGIVRNLDGTLIAIGGIEDHVHLLLSLPPVKAISEIVRDIKTNSSKWMNEQPTIHNRFEWQKGYSVFSVSYSQIEQVRTYIHNQQEHYRTKSFQEEYVEFLERHQIDYQTEYLFEAEKHG